jgi:signal transduction histidine kinase
VALAREVIDRFDHADDAGRISLEAPARLDAEVDVGRIDQVLTNLVDNALKYSPDGAPVEVALAEHVEGVIIEVRDRGIGLDDSAAQRLFEAFGRGENAEHFSGLGLGLHIAREIVSHHGGRIEPVSRDDGAGSVFRVILPLTGRGEE